MGALGPQLEGKQQSRCCGLTKQEGGQQWPPFLMSEFFDFDPLTGLRYDFDYNEETGDAIIHTTQDVSALLDYNAALRNAGATDKGIKESWWLYAKIPPIFMLKMRAKGINVEDGRHIDRVLAEINTNYPLLKTTQKNEGKKLAIIHDLGEQRNRS
jgi:hypothetical protein